MTSIKLVGKPSASASSALARHAQTLYDTPGSTRIAIVILKRRGVIAPDPTEETEPIVQLGIVAAEVATPEQEDHLREALTSMYVARTAAGTLDEAGQVTIGATTLEQVAGHLDRTEVARLRVGLTIWADYARNALRVEQMTLTEARHELDAVAAGLDLLLGRSSPPPPGE